MCSSWVSSTKFLRAGQLHRPLRNYCGSSLAFGTICLGVHHAVHATKVTERYSSSYVVSLISCALGCIVNVEIVSLLCFVHCVGVHIECANFVEPSKVEGKKR